eukprot:CAMPEP_0115132892 /NCGR_PEP_ID=MMETSP0227-20121206/54054_1 /TAXON_ID=89957 /ORGANISM="Polarella glacialis, Strain CCMP 1383" /LENGTH=152 /DNA_ID=CAMNT_0002538833 /DNA_START=161 /DNA_END=619 /DNA_ORIENTATION=+
MCREEAQEAFSHIDEFKAAGASRVVALVKENVGTEVEDFRKGYWPGDILMDKEQEFYKALGGGSPHKPFSGLVSFLAMLLNPFATRGTKQNLARCKAKKVDGNITGEGFVAGGCYVLRRDGTAAFSFLEKELGDHAKVQDILAALREATKPE